LGYPLNQWSPPQIISAETAVSATHNASNDFNASPTMRDADGKRVYVQTHHIGINQNDEGVLYEHRITERPSLSRNSGLRWRRPFSSSKSSKSSDHPPQRAEKSEDMSVETVTMTGYRATYSRKRSLSNLSNFGYNNSIGRNNRSSSRGIDRMEGSLGPPPESDTLRGFRSLYDQQNTRQYTIASRKKYKNRFLNWLDNHHLNLIRHETDTDNNVYNPGTYLYRYIDWTFYAGFMSVFMTFLLIYFIFCVFFGLVLLLAGNAEPECIVASSENFGANPDSRFSDAFALSWTTFTTVGYGMTYTATSTDFGDVKPSKCTMVFFLCTVEAFMGLLFAGMCAAILFGKVNRIQSHANIIFCNAVCLQYEEMDDDEDGWDEGENSLRSVGGRGVPLLNSVPTVPEFDIEKQVPVTPEDQQESEPDQVGSLLTWNTKDSIETTRFMDQFNGCPVLKFQVVNELCNREGSEIVDAIMKVVGIKFKGPGGRVTHSQYVRVNLMDFEHPFLSRVWTGVHILDSSSPLLNDRARQRIRDNNGSWPSNWFDPDVIRTKLEFHDLIVTVAGISNVSAVTVHAYKRYKIGDVLIGYNFAPIVFRDPDTGVLEVDLSMVNDVREQSGMRGEDLSIRRSPSKDNQGNRNLETSILIKKCKSSDALGDLTGQSPRHSSTNSSRIWSALSRDALSRDSLDVRPRSKGRATTLGLPQGSGDGVEARAKSNGLEVRRVSAPPRVPKPSDIVVPDIVPVVNKGRDKNNSSSRDLPLGGGGSLGVRGGTVSGLPLGSGDGVEARAKLNGLEVRGATAPPHEPMPSSFVVPDIVPVVNKGRDKNNRHRRDVSDTTMLVSNLTGVDDGEPETSEDDIETGVTRDGGETPAPAGVLGADNEGGQDDVSLLTVDDSRD